MKKKSLSNFRLRVTLRLRRSWISWSKKQAAKKLLKAQKRLILLQELTDSQQLEVKNLELKVLQMARTSLELEEIHLYRTKGELTSADSSFSGGGVGTVDASSLAPKWGEISEAIETRFQETYTNTALEEVKTEYGRYFDALEKHPRMLVGEEVPSLQGEGVEVLRDSADAREWQEAVQQLLIAEVKDRAQRGLEDERSTLDVLHGSIELFSNNHDLIPGTKGFNRELAERFTALTKDYEVRVDGKLTGYKVPVQGMIDSIRAQLSREAAAAPPAPAAPAAKKVAKTEPPQAGIPSKAGNSGDGPEDFSTLFGTLGLPNLRI